jgi:hypothetical protein
MFWVGGLQLCLNLTALGWLVVLLFYDGQVGVAVLCKFHIFQRIIY